MLRLYTFRLPLVSRLSMTLGLAAFSLAPALFAQVNVEQAEQVNPTIGSSNTYSADPRVPQPGTQPCTVQLMTDQEFADYSNKTFSYTPSCKGPWSKVVLEADFTVTAGTQYDRTAQFYLGGANIYFGSTAEPRTSLSPSWHVERDVTDLSALLTSAQSGTAILGNYVGIYGSTDYSGIIYANAKLVFYPTSFGAPSHVVPDEVIGLPGSGTTTLNDSSSQLSQTLTLPTNIEKVYLDVISQNQSNDEFFYFCVPSDVANELESCGNTAFRETEVTIDGTPAGVAPVYPWIFTGGVDPALWEPIPGVQTLNFKPYRVDLSPFAGVLSDGNQHTVALSVYNADSYFATTATLLLYLDKGTKQTSGALISNTLATSPTPTVKENLATDASGNVTGTVTVTAQRDYAISGYVNTSHGRVVYGVDGKIGFSNEQTFDITSDGATYTQDVVQSTKGTVVTTAQDHGVKTSSTSSFEYPLTFDYDYVGNSDGSTSVKMAADQAYNVKSGSSLGFFSGYSDQLANHVVTQDLIAYDASGTKTSRTEKSSQTYQDKDSLGYCYSRTLESAGLAMTSYKDGAGCPQRSFHW